MKRRWWMNEILIQIGFNKGDSAEHKANSGGNGPNPAACVTLVPENGDFEVEADCICASTDKEATKTAEKYSQKLKIPIQYQLKSLKAWNIGDLEEQPDSTKSGRIKMYVDWNPDEKVNGGESFNSFKKRVLKEIESILEDSKKERKKILVVTSNVCCKLVYAWFEGKSKDDVYNVDTEEFVEEGFRDPFPIRIEWNGSEFECEELEYEEKENEEEDD